MEQQACPFVLASRSPRREKLLREAGYDFIVRPSDVVEPVPDAFGSAAAYVAHAAWLKATDVVDAQRWVLGADTVAVANGQVLGKAADRIEAGKILRLLQGTRHEVLTGLCLVLPRSRVALSAVVATEVVMRPLSEAELADYLDSGQWKGKAGAYGIQDDDPFVETVKGSYSNVMGLPMEQLGDLLAMAARLEPT